jgi:hypothetical protein
MFHIKARHEATVNRRGAIRSAAPFSVAEPWRLLWRITLRSKLTETGGNKGLLWCCDPGGE